MLVPALAGLGAPHWRPDARGARSRASASPPAAPHIVRAALEAMAHQTHDLMTAFAADGAAWECLKIDGGMAANDWLAQDLADMLDLEVERPGLRRDHRARARRCWRASARACSARWRRRRRCAARCERFAPAMDEACARRGWRVAAGGRRACCDRSVTGRDDLTPACGGRQSPDARRLPAVVDHLDDRRRNPCGRRRAPRRSGRRASSASAPIGV